MKAVKAKISKKKKLEEFKHDIEMVFSLIKLFPDSRLSKFLCINFVFVSRLSVLHSFLANINNNY
jgi:hypothetical protein